MKIEEETNSSESTTHPLNRDRKATSTRETVQPKIYQEIMAIKQLNKKLSRMTKSRLKGLKRANTLRLDAQSSEPTNVSRETDQSRNYTLRTASKKVMGKTNVGKRRETVGQREFSIDYEEQGKCTSLLCNCSLF